jgi:hypothetical protein
MNHFARCPLQTVVDGPTQTAFWSPRKVDPFASVFVELPQSTKQVHRSFTIVVIIG